MLAVVVLLVGIVTATVVFFYKSSPKETDEASRRQDPAQTASLREGGEAPAGAATASLDKASTDTEPRGVSEVPEITVPADADSFDLEGVMLTPLPYCIFVGAYKDYKEAATTQSELDSNYLNAYIVPVEIKGNIAQSLFGVTQDGLWYRVLTGHFSSKETARRTLAVMMEELHGYQPEIMRFPYALECGRFLEADQARELSERMDQESVFHYTQEYPTTDSRTLTRVLVGCFFSRKGAEDQAGRLQGRGFSCQVTER